MAYTPPPLGATEVGKPTPQDVSKQDAHIQDLPPEVRRNFLLSMVFFPSAVGAAICLILFLGYWALSDHKKSNQYAFELREGIAAGSKRTRWKTAREIAENLNSKEVQNAAVLSALIEIVEKPELDEEIETWTPSTMIRDPKERQSRLRWWAAYLVGHLAGKLKDPKGAAVLIKTLQVEGGKDVHAESGLRFFSAIGLGILKDASAVEPLSNRLLNDNDPVVRAACAKSLGAIGERIKFAPAAAADQPKLEGLAASLRQAYLKDADKDVNWNAAIAMARLQDDTGRQTLLKLAENDDPVVQRNARSALGILEGKKQ